MRTFARRLTAQHRAATLGLLLMALTTLGFVPGAVQPAHAQVGCLGYSPAMVLYGMALPYLACPTVSTSPAYGMTSAGSAYGTPSTSSAYGVPSAATSVSVAPAANSVVNAASPSTVSCGSGTLTVSSTDLDAGASLVVGCYQSGATMTAIIAGSNGAGSANRHATACFSGASCQTVTLGAAGIAMVSLPPGASAPVSNSSSTSSSTPSATAAPASVTIQNFAFMPATVNVNVGGTVTWTNQQDGITHTVTADDGSFDSGRLSPGQQFSMTFSRPGTFTYHCSIHPNMHGTVTVGGGAATSSAPAATSPAPTTSPMTTNPQPNPNPGPGY